MDPKYKVGEFAKNLGVSSGFLKHHEQHGLLSPSISPSGYRYYEFSHAMQAVQCLRLQNIGFTAKEIADIMNNSAEMDIMLLMQEKKELLRKQMAFQEELLSYLDAHFPEQSDTDRSDALYDWSLEIPKPFYYLENAEEGAFVPYTPDMEAVVKDWNQYAPLTRVCTHISIDMGENFNTPAPSADDEADNVVPYNVHFWKMG